jgi:hypothetical protein
VSPSTGQARLTERVAARRISGADGPQAYRQDMTATLPDVRHGLGTHALLTAAGILGRQLGITAADARWRLDTDAENLGMSGTDLAELILYREPVAS